MKKILILFFAIGLLAACNSNPFTAHKADAKDDKVKNEKDDSKTDDGYADKDDKNTRKTNTDDEDTRSNWTNKQRDKWLNECIEASENNPQAKRVCSCVLDKMEKKYPDARDAENASEAEGVRLAKGCMEDLGIKSGNDDTEPYKRRDNTDEDDNRGGSWSNLQRQQFIQGCSATAQKAQGFTVRQADAYCDCMTIKVEKKYTFQQAARLTATDFQTREWQEAAADCLSNN
jgi:hypothetical protein